MADKSTKTNILKEQLALAQQVFVLSKHAPEDKSPVSRAYNWLFNVADDETLYQTGKRLRLANEPLSEMVVARKENISGRWKNRNIHRIKKLVKAIETNAKVDPPALPAPVKNVKRKPENVAKPTPIESPAAKYSEKNPENIKVKKDTKELKDQANKKIVKNAAQVRHTAEKEKIYEKQAEKNKRTTHKTLREKELTKKSVKEQVKKSPMSSNKVVTKPRNIKSSNVPPSTARMNDKIKMGKRWGTAAFGVGLAVAASFAISKIQQSFTPIEPSKSNPVSWDVRASAYIPEKASRGYDTFRESMTPFGSPIKLSKTKNVISRMKTSIRKGTMRTTQSMYSTALPFVMHNNAIGHTRY